MTSHPLAILYSSEVSHEVQPTLKRSWFHKSVTSGRWESLRSTSEAEYPSYLRISLALLRARLAVFTQELQCSPTSGCGPQRSLRNAPSTPKFLHSGQWELQWFPALCELWEAFTWQLPGDSSFLGNCYNSALWGFTLCQRKLALRQKLTGMPLQRPFLCVAPSSQVLCPANSSTLNLPEHGSVSPQTQLVPSSCLHLASSPLHHHLEPPQQEKCGPGRTFI